MVHLKCIFYLHLNLLNGLMKFIMKIGLLFACLIISFQGLRAQPVKIIFDTDMESDVDDVAALAMLHGFAGRGEAEILATISSSLNPWSAPVIDVINTWYGRPDIPIGNVKTFGVYRNSTYAKPLSEKYPHDIGLGETAPDAVAVYRKVLEAQPDSSVVVVTVGYLSNLYDLMKSEPDDVSPLSGAELVKKKVKHLVCMGGRYPMQQDPGRWGNFKPDPRAIQYVAKEWPTRIIFTVGGVFADAIPAGKILFQPQHQVNNPVSEAYQLFLKSWNRNWHHSADLIAVYVAVKGHEPYFNLIEQGYNHIFENGTNVWRRQPNDKRHFIVAEFAENIDPLNVAADFDELLVK
jgi:inosine-uridine nucleoside N-ribohydrolase